jgi:hypothetical protein
MAAVTLEERYAANMHGVSFCFDRIIITGMLPDVCYADGMTSFLCARDICIFGYSLTSRAMQSLTEIMIMRPPKSPLHTGSH